MRDCIKSFQSCDPFLAAFNFYSQFQNLTIPPLHLLSFNLLKDIKNELQTTRILQ